MSKNRSKRAAAAGRVADMIVAGATARTREDQQRVLELRRSNAAQPHGKRPTRAAVKARALREW